MRDFKKIGLKIIAKCWENFKGPKWMDGQTVRQSN
jgi:hypothetical protein